MSWDLPEEGVSPPMTRGFEPHDFDAIEVFARQPSSSAHRRPRGGSNSPHLIDNQAASPDAYKGNVLLL